MFHNDSEGLYLYCLVIYKTWSYSERWRGIFAKPFKMNIHYSQTLVFKKYFFENHVHTMTKLPFYTGPEDMADPVHFELPHFLTRLYGERKSKGNFKPKLFIDQIYVALKLSFRRTIVFFRLVIYFNDSIWSFFFPFWYLFHLMHFETSIRLKQI